MIVIGLAYLGNDRSRSSGLSGYQKEKGGLNNPGFLVTSSAGWVGAETPNSYYHFENFDTLQHGIRAWYINLYGKVRKGVINNTNQMIDILTPVGENAENARNNYKASVAQANNWLELGRRVFDFEANPQWKLCSNKSTVLQQGAQMAFDYLKKKYNLSGVPQYTLKP